MKNVFKLLTLIFLCGFLATSCSDDDDFIDSPEIAPLGDYENGILVSAEGGPASVSYISNDFSTTENDIYFNVNNEQLGVYLQSIGFNGGQAYIVSDNVNIINIVDRYTFVKEGSITAGLHTPRYMAFLNGKGYVSNWGDGTDTSDDYIAVINLSTNSVETTIPVGEGPEQIIANGNELYVSHKGGYNSNNIISVINASTNAVSTITVNDVPDEMIVNNMGELMVLCEGKPAWTGDETTASIAKIDMSTNTVTDNMTFASGVHPSQMSYDNGNVYYQSNNEVFVMNETATSLPMSSIINLGVITTYGMAVNNNMLYITDAKDYASLSDLLVYDLTSNALVHTFEVGKIASKIYFN
ncbi:YncE family protein [Bizionia arctica]|uniref:YncE family protein n=1 Tax=Bizionia arctica TaxID=1495645 RepID=A0A917LVE5_9FLAO|nr:YncE family protein [Bizionia arctica]GGG59427.1 hypothetical protein GCM10010976_32710 [Bizionia arctica]